MDAAGITHPPSTSTSHVPNDFADPLRPQTTLEDPNLRKRKSLRIRPSELLEQHNAIPPAPLRDATLESDLKLRTSRMSLFNLFSKPKVEKLRGYAEAGLESSTSLHTQRSTGALQTPKAGNASRAELQTQRAARDTFWQVPKPRPKPVPQVAAPQRTNSSVKEPQPKKRKEHTSPALDPLPLFQAYPQALKQGTLEVCMMTPEMVLQQAKSRTSSLARPSSSGDPLQRENTTDGTAPDPRTGAKGVIRHGQHGAPVFPRKLFVLVTSGYVLQYSEAGSSDRLPERILPLGPESAAFACDLIPGQHFVLQVSQTVDQHGQMVLSSGSFLSKFGIRSQAAKRVTATLLLVMPDANELGSWMSSIRQEIFVQGGRRAGSDASTQPTPESSQTSLKKTPSQSHRYQIKRDASKISIVAPSSETVHAVPSAPKSETADDASDSETLDGIEMEASKLHEPATTRGRAVSDALSVSSSATPSEEQQQLDKLRDSSRVSHSTVNTSATSRTNSLSSSPPSDQSQVSSEAARENALVRAPYRSTPSYSLTKRRSAVPDLPLPENGKLDPLNQHRRETLLEPTNGLPVMNNISPSTEATPGPDLASPQRRVISVAQSVPDFNLSAEQSQKHDSKFSPPHAMSEDGSRPESFVGDLPPPSTFIPKTSSYRNSLLQQGPVQQAPVHAASAPDLLQSSREPSRSPSMSDGAKPSPRIRSSFSLPLRVNPSGVTKSRPVSSMRHSPPTEEHNETPSPEPVVHTLSAKVDFATRTTISTSHIPPRRSSTVLSGLPSQPRSASARLSLFPSASPPPGVQGMAFGHSPSLAGSAGPQYANNNSNGKTLRRPTSMQVRSNHAPFLASVRNSTQGPPSDQRRVSATTVPIRSLKPSRAVAATQSTGASPPNSFAVEATDRAAPLPDATVPLRPSSRIISSSRRSSKLPTTLPDLDFGIPIVGLGPPAPPPSVPLPQLPPGGRSPGPLIGHMGGGVPRGGALQRSTTFPTGLGIQVLAP